MTNANGAAIDELREKVTESRNDVNRFRDETALLRAQLNNQIEIVKQKNDELAFLVEKREVELKNIRELLDEKRSQISYTFLTVTRIGPCQYDDCGNVVETWSGGSRIVYDYIVLQLIKEKDERLERLLNRIALYESYPGQSAVSTWSDSNSATNATVWDALPGEVRAELSELKERMMAETLIKPTKIFANKSTECADLVTSVQSETMRQDDSCQTPNITVYEPGSSIETSSESLAVAALRTEIDESKKVHDSLAAMLDCVRHAQIRGKLSPNIQQLLENLFSEVQQSDKSLEKITELVNRFFANLELALRRTLSAADDNRIRCEKLEDSLKKVHFFQFIIGLRKLLFNN
ncbi:unnamed protein product [Gongylonema pulchrum]|uniref:GRIP domain-containing protein n=1 Tax=Gongylonema pulchrum TaxID=637853 RepID=A0A183DTR3_9BILA|nr:unnamed protein product [Gongylonema pulchrum]